jgi:site-specific recombinase XerD
MEQGADLKVTGTELGHSDFKTIERYTASATKELWAEFEKQGLINRTVLEEEGVGLGN